MKIIITFFLLAFISSSVFSEDYYSKFYSDFNNHNKTFTQKINMNESEFRDPKELSLPWLNALVRIPKTNGEISRGEMKDFLNSDETHNKKYKTIIYLHGCSGIWSGSAKRIDFFANNGYAVIAPASMARQKYAQSCDTAISKGGLYRSVLKIRLIDAEHAVIQAKKLDWVDINNIFLVGHSEGGITTARYSPKSKAASVTARVIEGWTCNAGWDEYRGVNSPFNEPILSIVAKYDPWFQADHLRGDCGQFINENMFSKSVVIENDPILSKKHGIMHDPKVRKITLDFLKKVTK